MRPHIKAVRVPESRWQAYGSSFCSLPLSGDAEQKTQLALAGGWHLNVELVDEQERHSGLEIIEQRLQRRLLEFAVCHHADETGLGVRAALHVKLGRQHIAAGLGHGSG